LKFSTLETENAIKKSGIVLKSVDEAKAWFESLLLLLIRELL
jgi:hypothetical protein